MFRKFLATIFFSSLALAASAQHYTKQADGSLSLTQEGASHFASLALKCVSQEYPNKTGHIQVSAEDTKQPSEYHPAFYGCYDWHSSVHGHWMLVKLLKTFPDMPEAAAIREAIGKNLTAENIAQEIRYFEQKDNKSFERTYGWAWLLKLTEELSSSSDMEGRRWCENLKPLADLIVQRYMDFLPKQTYAIRSGVHPNSAFGISLALDYALATRNKAFEQLLKERSISYYGNDEACPAGWEPSGSDFLSPCLIEAELMSKVLTHSMYKQWLAKFFPELSSGKPESLFKPATVTDRSDLQLVHLDGLNLSRAWCMIAIARTVDDTKVREMLMQSATHNIELTLPTIANGSYAGEHWLASFAVYALFM